jgi:hypothetical protein
VRRGTICDLYKKWAEKLKTSSREVVQKELSEQELKAFKKKPEELEAYKGSIRGFYSASKNRCRKEGDGNLARSLF